MSAIRRSYCDDIRDLAEKITNLQLTKVVAWTRVEGVIDDEHLSVSDTDALRKDTTQVVMDIDQDIRASRARLVKLEQQLKEHDEIQKKKQRQEHEEIQKKQHLVVHETVISKAAGPVTPVPKSISKAARPVAPVPKSRPPKTPIGAVDPLYKALSDI